MQIQEQASIECPKALHQYPKVIQFLTSKARKSAGTAKTYGTVMTRLQRFLEADGRGYNLETILPPLINKDIDVYHFLDGLIQFYQGKIKSLDLTLFATKSYLEYWDVEIADAKLKNKVTLPEDRKEDERPLTLDEIKTLLLNADDLRFRAYLYLLASGGPRAVEAVMVRMRDIDFTVNPTRIYMQAKYSKNKLPREIYISNEATEYLKKWIDERKPNPDDPVFKISSESPRMLYKSMRDHFIALLKRVGLDQKKSDGIAENYERHELTLHSFRRFVETTIEDNSSLSFADYILGHKKSVYYTKKEPDRRQLYREKCLKALTYLDFKEMQRKIDEKRELEAKYENLSARLARAGF